MLKFLRKYQKWMLVVFCGGLMVAFLIPQAASQFAPQPGKQTMATTYGERKITRTDLEAVSRDLSIMRNLRMDPLPIPGMTLLPDTGSELDDAMVWTMIQHAAEHNQLSASRNEAFNLVASLLNVEDMEGLEKAARDLQVNGEYLIGIGKQYLKAEQYRQLVTGVEYTRPTGEEDPTGSPGIRRVVAVNKAFESVLQMAQTYSQFMPPAQAEQMALQQVFESTDLLDQIAGHARVSDSQLRYALQRENTELDLTVVVLDAEDRLESVTVDDAYVQKIFERFADDAAGTGEPYGVGYRVPNRVRLEALRVPIDAARAAVAETITAEDVRKFYDDNRGEYVNRQPEAEGVIVSQRMTPEQRDEIRQTLIQMGAEKKVEEIALQARLRLNEDARGLKDVGSFKQLPADFSPTPLVVVAEEIKQEHGIDCEVIRVDEWTSGQDIFDSLRFTQSWLGSLPGSTVRMPDPRAGFLMEQQVPGAVLGGKAGLFATVVPDLSQQGRFTMFAEYANIARPFIEEDAPEAAIGLQPGLPGMVLRDLTRSMYVFRITGADPSHPATDLEPIVDKVREDAKKIKAYEDLVSEEEALLAKAEAQTITKLMADADAKQTLTAVVRRMAQQPRAAPIEGLTTSGPILTQAFGLADKLTAQGGLDAASEGDRLYAVPMPEDYKVVVVRLDDIRPMSRSAFVAESEKPTSLMLASTVGRQPEPAASFSMEALMRYTGFEWAEGFGPEDLADDEDSATSEDDEAEDVDSSGQDASSEGE